VDGSDLADFIVVYTNNSPDADINGDGSINASDVARFAKEFGKI
jgi:hypothetical protein